jgi:hypothetical protein
VCGRRATKPHLATRYVGCWHRLGLAYQSTQTYDPRVYAAVRKGPHLTGLGDPRRLSIRDLEIASS